MKRLAFAMLSGCSQLLGLSEPVQETDAGAPPVDAPGPGTIRVIMGGTGPQGVVTSVPDGITCPGTCEHTFPIGTEVTLSATTVANSSFTGFFKGGCNGGPSCTVTPAGTVDIYARYFTPDNIWFTSSTVHKPGAFDSVAAADAQCDLLARDAGLYEREYIAWLPTSSQTALRRMLDLVNTGAPASLWRRPDGRIFAVTADDIQLGRLRFPPRLDEFGRDVGDEAIVLTDTLATGAPNSGNHCSDWASEAAPDVVAGEAAGGTGRFTEVAPLGCDREAHLYCLSAVEPAAPLPIAPLSESIVFVSKGTIAGIAGIAAMDALCGNEATTANLPHFTTRALVSPGGGKPVKDHFADISFAPTAPVMRPDGVVIADNMDALMGGVPFAAAPNVAADREYRNDEVWVGGGSFAAFQSDCNGWTNGAFGTTRFASTTRGATFTQQKACSEPAHILCFNGQVAMAKPSGRGSR